MVAKGPYCWYMYTIELPTKQHSIIAKSLKDTQGPTGLLLECRALLVGIVWNGVQIPEGFYMLLLIVLKKPEAVHRVYHHGRYGNMRPQCWITPTQDTVIVPRGGEEGGGQRGSPAITYTHSIWANHTERWDIWMVAMGTPPVGSCNALVIYNRLITALFAHR